MKSFDEDQLLMLSGIQHYAFCPRQWALIHIEKQWEDNFKTTLGHQHHEKVDDPFFFESRGDILISRSLSLVSYTLGFYGVADVVEFHENSEGISLFGREGLYLPIPIEYKLGIPKENDSDNLQLCLQAMCIEEMLLAKIDHGYLYYGKPKRRTKVVFDENLRNKVKEHAAEMHNLFERKHTPMVKKKEKKCNSCSLVDICLPKLKSGKKSVERYIEQYLNEV